MMFALNISDDGRILSATLDKFGHQSWPRMDVLPDGDISEYRLVNGKYVHDPLPVDEVEPVASVDERIAQLEEELHAAKILLGLEV